MILSEQLLSQFKEHVLSSDKEMAPMVIYQNFEHEYLVDVHDIDTALYLMELVKKIRKGKRRRLAASMVKI